MLDNHKLELLSKNYVSLMIKRNVKLIKPVKEFQLKDNLKDHYQHTLLLLKHNFITQEFSEKISEFYKYSNILLSYFLSFIYIYPLIYA